MKFKAQLISIALLFSISNTQAGNLFSITERGADCLTTTICDLLEDMVNEIIPDATTLNFLPEMADAAILANKGLSTDYASNVNVFVLGASLGMGIDLGEDGIGSGTGDGNATLPAVGIGGTVTLGANMGIFLKGKFWDRSTIYVNYFSYRLTTGSVSGELSSFGLHYQFKLLPPINMAAGLIKWGGIDISTGIETSSTKINTQINVDQTVTSGTATASYAGLADVGADISATSIPIEVTTNLRVVYALTLFGGLGFDYNSGTSKSIANITGPVTLGGTASGSGSASLDLGKADGPSTTSFRTIIGAQFNIAAIRLYMQKMAVIGGNDTQLSFGVRFAW
ncbi:MAG: hypothetical protein HN576_14055 [Bacteriovoracaceae bacterium]|jgi:hypothetical protein|nr:hypothetical protein [Bacteriovoracaceae bacterium]